MFWKRFLGSRSPANQLFFLVSSWTILVVNCLNNSEIFDFFVARKFALFFFLVKFGKPIIWENHFSQREPEQKWHFRKILFWFYGTKVIFISNYQIRFWGSPKHQQTYNFAKPHIAQSNGLFMSRHCNSEVGKGRRKIIVMGSIRFIV